MRHVGTRKIHPSLSPFWERKTPHNIEYEQDRSREMNFCHPYLFLLNNNNNNNDDDDVGCMYVCER